MRRLCLLPMLVPVFLLCACASPKADEIDPTELADVTVKADRTLALGPSRSNLGFVVPCAASTGCQASVAVSLQALSAGDPSVEVVFGRDPHNLRHIDTLVLDGGMAEKIVYIDEPPTTMFPASDTAKYDPRTSAILGFILRTPDESVQLDIVPCMYDGIERVGDASPEDVFAEPVSHNGYAITPPHTIHDSDDVDTFSLEVVDADSFDASIQIGKIVDLTLNAAQPSFEITGHYVCSSDESTLPFEVIEESGGGGDYSKRIGLDPDCPGADDSGEVVVTVSDPSASPKTCPGYNIFARLQPSYL